MPHASRRISVSALAASLALAAVLTAAPNPTQAQDVIDFGALGGEDALAGGSPFDGSERGPAVSGGERRDRFHDREFRLAGPQERFGRRAGERVRNAYWPTGRSIVEARPIAGSSYYRGTGIFANANPGSIVVFGDVAQGAGPLAAPGPKIIDVEAELMARRAIGADGISVEHSGTTKIIRLASGYGSQPQRAGRSDAERALTEAGPVRYPDPDAPEPNASEMSAADDLEPWSDAWMRHCVARYDNFDASLGTFTDEDGRRRFCIGGAD